MRRFAPTLLALAAVVGLLVSPSPVVHAHDDGHDAHAHSDAHVVHVILDDHEAHEHPATTPDGEPSEGHVHAGNTIDACARARGTATLDGPERTLGLPSALVGPTRGLWAPAETGRTDADPDPQRGAGRALDTLVALGRLLL